METFVSRIITKLSTESKGKSGTCIQGIEFMSGKKNQVHVHVKIFLATNNYIIREIVSPCFLEHGESDLLEHLL